jgi:hypothetical protein
MHRASRSTPVARFAARSWIAHFHRSLRMLDPEALLRSAAGEV